MPWDFRNCFVRGFASYETVLDLAYAAGDAATRLRIKRDRDRRVALREGYEYHEEVEVLGTLVEGEFLREADAPQEAVPGLIARARRDGARWRSGKRRRAPQVGS